MSRQNLWAPWRMSYIRQLEPGAAKAPAKGQSTCFLCDAAAAPPEQFDQLLVLLRDERGILLLNRYPYISSHLLVAPAGHLPELVDLSAAQRSGLMELAAVGQALLTRACHPQGLNLGINLGRCAGAGLPGHLHMHLVPRWHGDTNFMDVIAGVRVIPQALDESFLHLKETLKQMQS